MRSNDGNKEEERGGVGVERTRDAGAEDEEVRAGGDLEVDYRVELRFGEAEEVPGNKVVAKGCSGEEKGEDEGEGEDLS